MPPKSARQRRFFAMIANGGSPSKKGIGKLDPTVAKEMLHKKKRKRSMFSTRD